MIPFVRSLLADLRNGLSRAFPPPVTLRQHLRQNLIIGMAIVLLLLVFQDAGPVRDSREKSIDWLVRMHRGIAATDDAATRPFVLYDIDETSHEKWGEPFHVPRDKLARLMETALAAGPAVLFVDVELARPTPADDALLAVLQQHIQRPAGATLILLSGFKEKVDPERGGYLSIRDSFVNAALAGGASLNWANSLFERDRDQLIRRWKPFVVTCDAQYRAMPLPAVQLVALAAIEGSAAKAQLAAWLHGFAEESCFAPVSADTAPLVLGGRSLSVADSPFGQRILFSFPWQLEAGETRPETLFEGQRTRLLSVIPAHVVTEGGLRPDVPPGHVAVIGASHADARDIHATPLGDMPGSLLLINAMHSLFQHGQLVNPPAWLQMLSAALMLIVVSVIFMKFPSLKGAIISFVLLLLLLVPLSMYLFRYGVWLDFALPLTAVKVFQVVMEYHRKLQNRQTDHE